MSEIVLPPESLPNAIYLPLFTIHASDIVNWIVNNVDDVQDIVGFVPAYRSRPKAQKFGTQVITLNAAAGPHQQGNPAISSTVAGDPLAKYKEMEKEIFGKGQKK